MSGSDSKHEHASGYMVGRVQRRRYHELIHAHERLSANFSTRKKNKHLDPMMLGSMEIQIPPVRANAVRSLHVDRRGPCSLTVATPAAP